MSDARGLLDRITTFRQRLDAAPAVGPEPAPVREAEAFRQNLHRITGANPVAEGPTPPLTDRAQELVKAARGLLDRQRQFAADPLFTDNPSDADPLVAYHRETVAVMNSAVRMVQMLPPSPTLQLKLCDGLEGVLAIVRERLAVQERAAAVRRADAVRIDKLAAMLTAMSLMQRADLAPVAALAEELLDDARQSKPMRFVHADPLSTRSPGGPEFPAPARFLAGHAVNVAQVAARVLPLDYEWAGRPLVPVVAALLMDCGMMRVPATVLAQPGPLTPDQRRVVEQHAGYGADLVRRYMPNAGPVAAAVAAHHERADGTGYGAGLRGNDIPSLGRLLAVADVYAALCSPRPHRPAADTRAALTDVLLLAEQGRLDRDFAEYLASLSFYPVGTVVELTDGRVGVVAANHPNRLDPRAPGRPVVAVLAEADGTLLSRPDHVDLSAAARGGVHRTLPADRRRAVLGSRYPDLV